MAGVYYHADPLDQQQHQLAAQQMQPQQQQQRKKQRQRQTRIPEHLKTVKRSDSGTIKASKQSRPSSSSSPRKSELATTSSHGRLEQVLEGSNYKSSPDRSVFHVLHAYLQPRPVLPRACSNVRVSRSGDGRIDE